MQTRLSALKKGETGRIVNLLAQAKLRRRMLEFGLTVGTAVVCIQRAPFGGSMQIGLRGFSLLLGESEADCILIERVVCQDEAGGANRQPE